MAEAILLICSLLCIAPFLMVLIVLHNLTRVAKGQSPVSGIQALKEIIRNLFAKVDGSKLINQKNSSTRKEKHTENKKIDDAEFTEIED